VVVESPFAGANEGEVERNIRYARACMRDALLRGEAPFASHLLYTQPGILRDTVQHERMYGIEAGLVWGARADLTVVYTDLGISQGMELGIRRAEDEGRNVQFRKLDEWSDV
jgi:hypothetical protein